MSDSIRFVGLDVHAKTIALATATGRDPAVYICDLTNDFARLLKVLDRLGSRDSLHCAYEAGPTGYGLCRALTQAKIRCEVIAPSKMPSTPIQPAVVAF